MSTLTRFNSTQPGKLQSSRTKTLTEECMDLLYNTFQPSVTMHKWDEDGNLIIDHKDD